MKIDIKVSEIFKNKMNEEEIIFLSSETEILCENIIIEILNSALCI